MTMNVNLVKTNKPDLQKVNYATEEISN